MLTNTIRHQNPSQQMMWGSTHIGPTFFPLGEKGEREGGGGGGDFRLLKFGVPKCILCDYCSLGSVSTLTKWIINFFQKISSFQNLKFENFHDLLSYCYMTNEIIQSVAYDNYDDFQHTKFIFHKNSFPTLKIIWWWNWPLCKVFIMFSICSSSSQ